jgi:hypothetical protein
MNKAFFSFYYTLLFCHFIACLWLVTGRLDPMRKFDKGWQYADNFTLFSPTLFEMWMEGFYFSVSTLTGGAMGNVLPTTNIEYIVATFINLMGRCVFVGFFTDIAIEYLMRNVVVFENQDRLEKSKQFA